MQVRSARVMEGQAEIMEGIGGVEGAASIHRLGGSGGMGGQGASGICVGIEVQAASVGGIRRPEGGRRGHCLDLGGFGGTRGTCGGGLGGDQGICLAPTTCEPTFLSLLSFPPPIFTSSTPSICER